MVRKGEAVGKAALKHYNVNGNELTFDTDAFRREFDRIRKGGRANIGEMELELAEALFVTADAVHAWRMHKNGPSDMEKIESLAGFLGVAPTELLRSVKGKDMAYVLTDRQYEALRRIYVAVVEYLDEFERTNGFNDCWFDFVDAGVDPSHVEEKLWELAECRHHAVSLAADKEGFDLRGLPVYDEVIDFIEGDLVGIYGGKLSYGYRFEAPVEDVDGATSGVTLWDDLKRARSRMDEVFDLRS